MIGDEVDSPAEKEVAYPNKNEVGPPSREMERFLPAWAAQ